MSDGFRPSPRLGQPTTKSNGETAMSSSAPCWASQSSAAAAEKAQLYKVAAKEAMEQAGIHNMFLEDSHWASLWSKHFERRVPVGHVESAVPFDTPIPPLFEGRTLRVLQWNLLAEGLVPEGFLMPLVSKTHVESLDSYLSDLLKSGKQEDLDQAARLSAEGHRNVVLRIEESGDQSWEAFARMACEMVVEMKGLPADQKQARGIDLKYKYDGEYEKKRHYINMVYEDFGEFHKHKEPRVATDGQLSVNEKAVVKTDHRLLRVLWFTVLLQPDIVCFQELDNFTFVAEEMSKLGYACGMTDAPEYVLLKDRVGDTYQDKVNASPWAFAPKWGRKKDKSTARFFLEKRIKDGTDQKATFMGKDFEWPVDDDGQAIFWRRDRFRIVGKPEFMVLPGDKDMQEFVAGDSGSLFNDHGDQSAVRVLLEFTPEGERVEGQQFYVATTHLSSGADAECARILELRYLQEAWGRPGLPEIWALDANTEINFEDCSGSGFLGVNVPVEANALRTFMRQSGLSSVWQQCYDDSKGADLPPASVWKMRGSASKQPKKVGEDMYQLIDHIFYNGRGLFSLGEQALRLREKLMGDFNHRDWLALMPNELLPSDHLPILWDFEVASCPRREAPVLLVQAQRLWRKLLGTMGGDIDAGIMEEMRELLYLHSGTDTPTEGNAPKFPPTETDLFRWLELLATEARAVLGASTDISDKIRTECINRKGKRSSEDLQCCILTAYLFAVGATLLADMPPRSIVGTGAWTNGLCTPSLVGALETMSLAALRNIGRAQMLAWKRSESIRYDDALTGLAAQLIENLYGGPGRCRCPRMVEVFDSHGKLSSTALDALLVEVRKELESTVSNKAPACLALRSVDWKVCGSGHQVMCAVRMILGMLEAGGIEFHEKSVDLNVTASLDMMFSPSTASGAGAAAVSAIRNNTMLEQSFDESTVVSAFSGLAKSPNFDSGGGLALLLESLSRQLSIVERLQEGRGRPEREARALDRPCPITLAAFIRRATISACEEVWPINILMVATQKLDARTVHQYPNQRPNRCPAYDLVQALRQFPNRDECSQLYTLRRILRILCALCKTVGPDDILPPVVHGNGMARFKEILFALQRLDQDSQLRWQTLATLTYLLDLLLHSKEPGTMLAATLQGKVRAAVEEPTFKMLFLQRPPLETNSWSYDMRTVLEKIDEFEIVKKLTSRS